MTDNLSGVLVFFATCIVCICVYFALYGKYFSHLSRGKRFIGLTVFSLSVSLVVSFVFSALKTNHRFDTPLEAFSYSYSGAEVVLCEETDTEAFIIYRESKDYGVSFTCIPKDEGEWKSVYPVGIKSQSYIINEKYGFLHTVQSPYSRRIFNVVFGLTEHPTESSHVTDTSGQSFYYFYTEAAGEKYFDTFYYLITESPLPDNTIIINGEKFALTA